MPVLFGKHRRIVVLPPGLREFSTSSAIMDSPGGEFNSYIQK